MSSQPELRSRASRGAFSFSRFFALLLRLCVFGLVGTPVAHAVTIQITYTDNSNEGFFNPTLGEKRRAAFRAVLNNWGYKLEGTVPIQVYASFDPLTDEKGNKRTILAQASPYSYRRDWSNFFNQLPPPKRAATYYPIALANQQADTDLDSGHPDIVVQCNSNIDSDPATGFYYGLDADVPAGQSDFYTVLYHEVGHGLGFTSAFNQDGSFALENGYANIYDVFLRSTINGSTQYLTKVTQAQRAAAFTNGHVWFAGENAQLGGGEDSCLLYAPSSYSPGSTISHLDEDTFHSIDELMTPFSSEAIHAPGPRVAGVFKDMGWGVKGTDLKAPALTISAPANGAVISQALTNVKGTVSDAGGLGRVRVIFKRNSDSKFWSDSGWETDSTLLKAAISGNTWTLLNVPSGSNLAYGSYNLYVTAWDAANNTTVVTSSFDVADVSEPNVTVASPVEGQGYKGLASITGSSSNNTDYVKVALRNSDDKYWNWNTSAFGGTTFVDSDNAKRIQVPPTNWQTSLPTVPDGDYIVFAAGVNTADVGSQYVSVSYYLDTSGPDLELTSPAPASSTQALTALSGTCTDRSGIKDNKVTFTLYQNGQYWTGSAWTNTQMALSAMVQEDGTWTYTTLPTESNARSGVYYFSGSATDGLGNLSTAGQTNQTNFRVDSSPPICTITSPVNGSSVNGITSITGTANDENLDRVSLYIVRYSDGAYWDGTAWGGGGSAILPVNIDSSTHVWTSAGSLPGNSASDPAHSWTNGSYDIIAIAYDQAGNQTRADSVVTYQYAYTWTGATMRDNDPNNNSNNWDVAANWSPYGVPGADDNALIKNGDTVQADGSHSVKGLIVSGSTLNTTGLLVKNLDLNGNIYGGAVSSNGGTWNWSGGNMSGTWNVLADANLNVSGDGTKQLGNSSVINNSGTATFTGSGTLQGYQNSTFNNLQGATFTLNNSSAVFSNYYGGNVFNNAAGATFKKQNTPSDATSVSTMRDWTFNNNGSLVCNTGILDFVAGLNSNDGSTISGSGRTRLSGGTLVATGNATVRDTIFDMTGGLLGGSNPLTTTGSTTFNWMGGTISQLNVGAGTSLVISGTGTKQIDNSGVINNSGTTTLTDVGVVQGYQNSTFNNLKGGVFTAASDAAFVNYYGSNAFNNQSGATFEKTVGTATTSNKIDWAFNNSGTTRVTQGVLALNGSNASTDAGTFTTVTPGIVRFIGGAHNLKTGTTFTGTGKTQLAGGTLVIGGTVFSGSSSAGATFEVSSGTISGPATTSLTCYGTVNWTGGTIGGVFNVGNKTALNLTGADAKQVGDSGIINNVGTTTWMGPGQLQGYQNSTFNNNSGGVFNVAATGEPFANYYGGNVFNNATGATLLKTGNTISKLTNWAFNTNGGAISVAAGTLQTLSVFSGKAPTTVSGAGTLQLDGRNSLNNVLTSTARVLLTGTLNCSQPKTGAAPSHYKGAGIFDWTSGVINGTLAFDAGTKLNLSGTATKQLGDSGILNNAGTITWTSTGALQGYQNSTVNNQSGGIFKVATDGAVTANYYGGNSFNNLPGATFTKSAGSGTSIIGDWTFNSKGGLISMVSGTLQSKSPFNLPANTSVSGVGTLQLSGSTSFAATLNSASRVVLDGALTCTKGTPACQYAGTGAFDWTKGSIDGVLTLGTGTKVNLSGADTKLLGNSSIINNSGTVTWIGPGALQGYQNSTFNNNKGGAFNVATDGNLFANYYSGNVFNNNLGATFAKTGGTATSTLSDWTFYNAGSVLANAGVATTKGCALEFKAALKLSGGTIGGTRFSRFNGTTLNIVGTPVIANTTLDISGGTVNGTGLVAATGTGILQWTGGSVSNLNIAKSATMNIVGTGVHAINDGGVLTNSGTLNWRGGDIQGYQNSTIVNSSGATFIDTSKAAFTNYYYGNAFRNAGTFKTGTLVGSTKMAWGFTQTSSGILSLDVTSTATTGFDQYSVGGKATLGGTLQIVRPSSFLPVAGSKFKFLTAGTRTGTFGTVQNTTIDSTRSFQAQYNPNDVTLIVASKTTKSSSAITSGHAKPKTGEPVTVPMLPNPRADEPIDEPSVPVLPVPKSNPSSSVTLSSGEVDVEGGSIHLAFTQRLDTGSAGRGGNYHVTVNGSPIEVQSASLVNGHVTLLLSEGALRRGDAVRVEWHELKDDENQPLGTSSWQNGPSPS